MKLSPAGLRLLRLAEQILPQVQAMQDEFSGLRDGRSGRMHIAIECHACFEWLFPVLERFRKDWPDVDVDIRPGLAFDALPALLKEEVDLVVSSDPEELAGVEFIELFDYAPVFVASKDNPLAAKPYIEAEDFRDQTLITYPVERSRLDVFSQLLNPAKVEPAAVRQAELTAVILLLVASNRGVSVLPDWVVREVKYSSDYVTRPLTAKGLKRRLYAAVRSDERGKPYMERLISLARIEARKLQQA
jgi:LysR family transcriptional regulator for metE and metH